MKPDLEVRCRDCNGTLNAEIQTDSLNQKDVLIVKPCPTCLSDEWDDGYESGTSEDEY